MYVGGRIARTDINNAAGWINPFTPACRSVRGEGGMAISCVVEHGRN